MFYEAIAIKINYFNINNDAGMQLSPCLKLILWLIECNEV